MGEPQSFFAQMVNSKDRRLESEAETKRLEAETKLVEAKNANSFAEGYALALEDAAKWHDKNEVLHRSEAEKYNRKAWFDTALQHRQTADQEHDHAAAIRALPIKEQP